jgi:hypothetical protein
MIVFADTNILLDVLAQRQPFYPPAAALWTLAAHFGRPVTFTCAPPGSGERIGVDRDGDGAWDGDERDAHTNPADPASKP